MSFVLGVDIGATYTRVVLADNDGTFLARAKTRTPREDDSLAVAHNIIRAARHLLREQGVSDSELKGIGVGSIGPLDMRRGILIRPANLPVENVEVVAPLSREFGVPTYLVNDCVAAAIGEKHFGAGRDVENLVYITISTGIGSGVYVNGHLLLGKDGNAHEVGHIVVDAEGKLVCGCGKRGHWEAYSSGTGIPQLACMLISERGEEAFRESVLYERTGGDPKRLDAKMIYDAAKEGDALALEIVREAGRYNAIGVANVINVYDPELITMGGSVTLNNVELVLGPIKEMVGDYVINRPAEIRVTPLGEDVGLYGAVALALGLEEIPESLRPKIYP